MERECRKHLKKVVWIGFKIDRKATPKSDDGNISAISRASAGTLKITAIFERQRELQSSENRSEEQGLTTSRPRNDQDDGLGEQERQRALKDLEMLLNSKREQIRKYGRMLVHEGDFYRRHCMVRNFMYMQKERNESGRVQSRQKMAEMVAITFDRRQHTGRKIV